MAGRTDTKIKLKDGRTLGYVAYGDPNGKPLLYFHGHPGARVEAGFLAETAIKLRVRLVGIDRPGLGISTYKSGRHFLDWPDDVVELADYLNLDTFAVVGFSGGGPYALACAKKIPERLTACGVVSGVGKSSPFVAFLASFAPWLILPMTKRFFANDEIAMQSMRKFTQKWAKPDRDAFVKPDVAKTVTTSLVEAMRQGTRGAAYDGMLIGSRNWDFQLEDIAFSNIHLWHGELDDQIKVTQARESVKRLPHCEATFYPGDGHISTIANHADEIVRSLMQG